MMSSPKERFFKAKREATHGEYIPKYKIGDFVYNKKYGVLSRIDAIDDRYKRSYPKGIWDEYSKATKASMLYYTLTDIANPQVKIVGKYTKQRTVETIDTFYIKVEEKAAKILYGSKK